MKFLYYNMRVSFTKNGAALFRSICAEDLNFDVITMTQRLRGVMENPIGFAKGWSPAKLRACPDLDESSLPFADIMRDHAHGGYVLSEKAVAQLDLDLSKIGLVLPVELLGPGAPYSTWIGGRCTRDLVDWQASHIVRRGNGSHIQLMTGMEIPDCFSILQSPGLFVSERIKHLIDAAGLTGVQFFPVEIT